MIAATISWLHATINRVGREFNEVKNKFKKSHVFDDYDDKKIKNQVPPQTMQDSSPPLIISSRRPQNSKLTCASTFHSDQYVAAGIAI